ncbi:hypothetical protein D9M72_575480 [compost metagenome]
MPTRSMEATKGSMPAAMTGRTMIEPIAWPVAAPRPSRTPIQSGPLTFSHSCICARRLPKRMARNTPVAVSAMPPTAVGDSASPSTSQPSKAAIGALRAKRMPERRGPSRLSAAKSSVSPMKMPIKPDKSSGVTLVASSSRHAPVAST